MRPSGRATDELREVSFQRQFTKHAAGSTLISMGDTKVLCTASVDNRTPPWLKGTGSGWVDHRIGYKKGVAFPLEGRYTMDVVHAMRRDPLPGISDIRFAMFDRSEE